MWNSIVSASDRCPFIYLKFPNIMPDTIGGMAVSFRRRKVSFPIKEKTEENTIWIAEKIISLKISAPKQ